MSINTREHSINDEIRDREVRVVGEDGSQLGIMSSRDAIRLAEEKNLDLVKIAPQAVPPVCRIMDYGKFCFEKAKKEKENRKNQHIVDVKEVRLSLSIDTNDLNTKINNAKRFLTDGDKVKVSVRFRGREMTYTQKGQTLLMKFAESCSELSNLEKPPKMEGRSMAIFLSSKISK